MTHWTHPYVHSCEPGQSQSRLALIAITGRVT